MNMPWFTALWQRYQRVLESFRALVALPPPTIVISMAELGELHTALAEAEATVLERQAIIDQLHFEFNQLQTVHQRLCTAYEQLEAECTRLKDVLEADDAAAAMIRDKFIEMLIWSGFYRWRRGAIDAFIAFLRDTGAIPLTPEDIEHIRHEQERISEQERRLPIAKIGALFGRAVAAIKRIPHHKEIPDAPTPGHST